MSENPTGSFVIRLFGTFEISMDGKPLPRLRSRSGHWLLALLLFRHDSPVQRDWLEATLWPDSQPEQAAYNLRRSLSDLRKALGAHAARLSAPSVHTLVLDLSGADADIAIFDAAMRSSDPGALAQAVDLYRGPLLPDCLEEWIYEERALRQESYLTALEQLADAATQQQEHDRAILYLRRLVAADWMREEAQRTLMQALEAQGELVAALHVYNELRHRLRDAYPPPHLPVEPTPETKACYQRIAQRLRQQPPVPSRPTNLPPGSAPPNNLSRPLTDFIGREREVAEAGERLMQGPMLTLTGPGGAGKTRLARQIAGERLHDFSDGVWIVELGGLADPALVPHTVAAAVGIREGSAETPLLDTLCQELSPRALLLVLDGCEHLAEMCARLAHALLSACPDLRILATSRQALGIVGEWRYPVPPLSLPTLRHDLLPETVLRSEAVRLFVSRARAVRPSFALDESNAFSVGHICRRLDGLPLAIELAAAQLLVQSAAQIEMGLDHRFRLLTHGSRSTAQRQQTLQAMVDWSYDLLSSVEQRLFRYLAVFAGSFSLEAVETICAGKGVSPGQILDLLYRLVEKSMVVDEDKGQTVRFHLLETLRLYGLEKLRQSGEEEDLRSRHLDYFLQLSERADPTRKGPEEAIWYDRLEAEHDNLRAALAWASHREEGREKALRLAGALWPFWHVRGYEREGRTWLAAAPEDSLSVSAPVRAKALHGAGTLALMQGDHAAARACLQESLVLWRELNHPTGMADASANLGVVAYYQGDNAEARAALQTSLGLRRESGDVVGVANALVWLGNIAHDEGNYSEAQRLYEESLTIYREQNNPMRAANVLNNLAVMAREQEALPLALSLYEQSLALFRQAGNRAGIAGALNNLGNARREHGDGAEARGLLEESLEIQRELGDAFGIPLTLNTLGLAHCTLGDYAAARRCFTESANCYLEREDRSGLAYAFTGLADVCLGEGDPVWAARLLGAAASLRAAQGASLSPADQRDWNRSVAAVRAALTETEFADAQAVGAVISWRELLTARVSGASVENR